MTVSSISAVVFPPLFSSEPISDPDTRVLGPSVTARDIIDTVSRLWFSCQSVRLEGVCVQLSASSLCPTRTLWCPKPFADLFLRDFTGLEGRISSSQHPFVAQCPASSYVGRVARVDSSSLKLLVGHVPLVIALCRPLNNCSTALYPHGFCCISLVESKLPLQQNPSMLAEDSQYSKTLVLGNAIPVLGVKPKRGWYVFWRIFKVDLCSAISFERSRRELSIDVAEHRSMLKNY